MKNLKLFDTESQYETAKVEFEYPTVSYVEDTDTVYYMEKPHDYSKDYLTFEALESGTFTLTIPSNINSTYMTSVSYSTDNGETWTTTNIDSTTQIITTPTIAQGGKVLWKGVGNALSKASSYTQITGTNNFNVSGNIMSLLYGDNFTNQVVFPSGTTRNMNGLFINNTKLISAENLIMPATTVTENCYYNMFSGCTSLTTAPELPATTLASSCYNSMFQGCTSLTTAPELPATTLANNCYSNMFRGCTSLTTAPELPATTLANNCYYYMFSGCTALTTAPKILPATTLASYCYYHMFDGCTSLTTAPELPATTLVDQCYYGMFKDCIALTTAPELPATTLVTSCYRTMFSGCTSLCYIKAMFTTLNINNTYEWVKNVASNGTFVKNNTATWNVTGTSGIPSGWAVETASA